MKILSHQGFQNFSGIINQGIPEKLLKIEFDDSSFIKATPDHKFLVEDIWVNAFLLDVGDILSNKTITNIEEIEPEVVYDMFKVEEAHSYYSSGVYSHNCSFLYIDECVEGDTVVTILKDGLESSITIDSLYRNIIKAEIQYKNGYKVLTENGFKSFDGIKRTIAPTIEIIFSDDSNLKCTKSHLIKTNNKFTEAINLNIGDAVGELFVKSILKLSDDEKYVYDLLNVADGHHYITNNVTSHNCAFVEGWVEFYKSVYPTISSGQETKVVLVSTPNGLNFYYKLWDDAVKGKSDYIPIKVTWKDVPGRDEEWKRQTIANTSEEAFIQEHEAEFIGSAGTLIDGWRLKELVEESPVRTGKYSKMYEEVVEGHIYALCADVSRGKGIDNSAYIVVDVTNLPYKIVSTYYCPVVPPDMFAEFIYQAHIYYNDAFVVVENNDAGCETLRVLNDTYECESILGTKTDSQARKVISINGGNNFEFGVRTTKTVKAVGCTRMKQLVESGSIQFGDRWLIDELNKFIRVGKSYEAQKDAHDDIVMCLAIFSWLTTQYLFEDLTSIDTRFNLRNKKESEYVDDLLPFGYVIDGLDTYGDDTRVDFQSIELPDYEDTEFYPNIQNRRKIAEEDSGFFD